MKKLIIAFMCTGFLFVYQAEAQDLTSKKGETILPEEGDYALGFDANPFLNYVGNFLNQSGNTAPDADFVSGSNLSIVGKMFKDAQTAYRGRVRLGFGNTSRTFQVMDDANTDEYVEDKITTSYTSISLGGGLEKRRGNTRVQGLYGGEALVNLNSFSRTAEFGNEMANGGATSVTDFTSGTTNFVNNRTTSTSTGMGIGVTVRGFAGIEIFVFPKTSIAFEYGWGVGFNTQGGGETENESWNSTEATTNTTTGPKASSFGIDTDNGSGRLTILFHM